MKAWKLAELEEARAQARKEMPSLFAKTAPTTDAPVSEIYKPDAKLESRGKCARCGRSGVWIMGAGEVLCAAHQDDY